MVVCACVSISAEADEPKHIGSTSLCGDAYLRALAPEQIGALSWQSRDHVSRASTAEKKLPQIWDDPEVILASGLDHIVFGPGEGARSKSFLTGGIQATHLIWGEDFEAVKSNYLLLGSAMNMSAEYHIQSLENRLVSLPQLEQSPKILYLARDGGSTGPGTFVDAVIRAAGGINIITSPGWQKPDAELILSFEPDIIITSYFEDGYDSVNAVSVRHKAIRDFIASHETVEIPGALWPCAGPGLIEAAEILNTKIMELP